MTSTILSFLFCTYVEKSIVAYFSKLFSFEKIILKNYHTNILRLIHFQRHVIEYENHILPNNPKIKTNIDSSFFFYLDGVIFKKFLLLKKLRHDIKMPAKNWRNEDILLSFLFIFYMLIKMGHIFPVYFQWYLSILFCLISSPSAINHGFCNKIPLQCPS